MTTPSKTRNPSSSGERRRLIEESTARAMDLYRLDFEATRAKTSRLREEREALEALEAARAAPPAPRRRPAAKKATPPA